MFKMMLLIVSAVIAALAGIAGFTNAFGSPVADAKIVCYLALFAFVVLLVTYFVVRKPTRGR